MDTGRERERGARAGQWKAAPNLRVLLVVVKSFADEKLLVIEAELGDLLNVSGVQTFIIG